MKKILGILIVTAAATWLAVKWLKSRAEVGELQQGAVNYTQGLQNDVSSAKAAEDQANALVKKEEKEAHEASQADSQ